MRDGEQGEGKPYTPQERAKQSWCRLPAVRGRWLHDRYQPLSEQRWTPVP
jgi:hypothetical protein